MKTEATTRMGTNRRPIMLMLAAIVVAGMALAGSLVAIGADRAHAALPGGTNRANTAPIAGPNAVYEVGRTDDANVAAVMPPATPDTHAPLMTATSTRPSSRDTRTMTPTSTPISTITPTNTNTPAHTSTAANTATATPTCLTGGYRILVVYAGNPDRPNTLLNQLREEPGVRRVDHFNASRDTPDLAFLLQRYDIVFTYSWALYADPDALGNVLADYQDAGGIVIAGSLAFSDSSNWPIRGRWRTQGYSPFITGNSVVGAACLGAHDPTHPLMDGVTALCIGVRRWCALTLAPGAVGVANWNYSSQGNPPAVAYKTTNGTTAIGINAVLTDPQNWSGHYSRIIVNAGRWLKPPCATPIGTATYTRTPFSTPTNSTLTRTPVPVGEGSISGRASLRFSSGSVAAGAVVYACTQNGSHCSPSLRTNAQGDYLITGLITDTYNIVAFPPGGHNVLPDRLSGIVVENGPVTGQNVVFRDPNPHPSNVGIRPNNGAVGNLVSIPNGWDFTLSATQCRGGTAHYEIHQDGRLIRTGPMLEDEYSPGTYTAEVLSLREVHGVVHVTIVILCPNGVRITIEFIMYIDPSGVVQSFLPNGTPAALPLSTVTLYRSDDPNGPFTVVPDGDAIMSPSNRKNSDITRLKGHFGWDVVPGYYKVRANKAGCVKPGDPSQPYVDTHVMEIPPPVTDLVLRLDCGRPSFTDVHTNDYFYNAVTYLAAIGVLSGYDTPAQCPTGTPCFLPYNSVTRGQAVKIIANAVGLAKDIPSTQQTFQDVDPNSNPFWVYIERMAQQGHIGGYPCGQPGEPCVAPGNKAYFRWSNNMTRNQLAKVLVLANQYDITTAAGPHFQDVPADDPFYGYVETAYQKGLIGGYECGGQGERCVPPGNRAYFRGGANATRGQLSKMVTLTLTASAP